MGVSLPALITAAAAAPASITATAVTSTIAATGTAATGTLESIVTSVVPSLVASVLPSGATTTAPVTSQPLFMPVPFEVAAIFAGALSGAMTGVTRRFDIMGLVVLAVVTGLGGGIIRDVLLQDYGIFALDNPRALVATLLGAAVGAFFFTIADKTRPVLALIDAASLGLFTLVGADKALVAGLTPLAAVMLGTITAIGGGIMRDILSHREAQVMRRGSLYAVAAVVGSTIFVTLVLWLNVAKPVAMVLAAGITIILRLGSLWLGWESPEPFDLTDRLTAVPVGVYRASRRALFGRGRDDKEDHGTDQGTDQP